MRLKLTTITLQHNALQTRPHRNCPCTTGGRSIQTSSKHLTLNGHLDNTTMWGSLRLAPIMHPLRLEYCKQSHDKYLCEETMPFAVYSTWLFCTLFKLLQALAAYQIVAVLYVRCLACGCHGSQRMDCILVSSIKITSTVTILVKSYPFAVYPYDF